MFFKKYILTFILTSFFIIVELNCSSVTVFIHKQFDPGAIKRIAVLPFKNVSRDPLAGEKVMFITISEIMSYDLFEIVENSFVNNALKQHNIQPNKITIAQ